MKYIFLTLVIAAAVFVIVGLRRALQTYLKFRGKRLVSSIARTFRREYPELVVDRPETPLRMSILK